MEGPAVSLLIAAPSTIQSKIAKRVKVVRESRFVCFTGHSPLVGHSKGLSRSVAIITLLSLLFLFHSLVLASDVKSPISRQSLIVVIGAAASHLSDHW